MVGTLVKPPGSPRTYILLSVRGRAIDWGFCNYRYLEEYNPFLKPLHGNPRFQRLIDKARMKHEAFDA